MCALGAALFRRHGLRRSHPEISLSSAERAVSDLITLLDA